MARRRRLKLEHVDPFKVRMPQRNVRRYRDSKWFESFLSEVKANSVSDPIRVCKAADYDRTGEYELIDGYTRCFAARLLGLKSILALVVDRPEDLTVEAGRLNVWQQSLDPVSMAHYVDYVLHKNMMDLARTCELLHLSERHVKRLLKLLSLPEEVKLQIARGERPAFPESHLSGDFGHRVQKKKGQGGFGQRCVICGRWPENGKRKWILFCVDHEDEWRAVLDYIARCGWKERG